MQFQDQLTDGITANKQMARLTNTVFKKKTELSMHNMTLRAAHFTVDVQTGSAIYSFRTTIAEEATSETRWSQNIFCVQ